MFWNKSYYLIITFYFIVSGTQIYALSPDYSSPEGVVLTFYEAVKERNLEILSECVHPESTHREAVRYYSRSTSNTELEQYERRLGEWGGVISVDYNNPHEDKGWVRVKVEFYQDTGETKVISLYVAEHDMGYRIISF